RRYDNRHLYQVNLSRQQFYLVPGILKKRRNIYELSFTQRGSPHSLKEAIGQQSLSVGAGFVAFLIIGVPGKHIGSSTVAHTLDAPAHGLREVTSRDQLVGKGARRTGIQN